MLAVLTQPDRPSGRGMRLVASPVKELALQHGIPVLQPGTLKTPEIQDTLVALKADVMVVAAYGLILPQAVLDIPRYGCLNIHASLLPRWRGAAPIQRAIQCGDLKTGITIMQMDQGLDTGAMLLSDECLIAADETADSLHDKLAGIGAVLICQALQQLPSGLTAVEQDGQVATYAAKLLKSEAKIDWQLDAAVIERSIRAFNPFPVCQFEYQQQMIKVWSASLSQRSGTPGEVLSVDKLGITVACGTQALRLETLQRPGGKAQPAAQFIQAMPISIGAILSVS